MKTLILVRHAKSSWDDAALTDFERPLNERGKNDAPLMAARLKERKVIIDAFISSPARRAEKTARLFMEELETKRKEMVLVPSLYHASPEVFYQAIAEVNDSLTSVALFSHNPGITAFADELTPEIHIDNMPTCSVFAVKININKWADFRAATKEFLFFDYPKKVS